MTNHSKALIYVLCVVNCVVHTTALLNCTLARPTMGSVFSASHIRASIYLLCFHWSIKHLPTLTATQPTCPAERAVYTLVPTLPL